MTELWAGHEAPEVGFPAGTRCSRRILQPGGGVDHCDQPPVAQVTHDGHISYYCSDHYERYQELATEWFG